MHKSPRTVKARRGQAPAPKYCPFLLNLRLFFDAFRFLHLLWQVSDPSEQD